MFWSQFLKIAIASADSKFSEQRQKKEEIILSEISFTGRLNM